MLEKTGNLGNALDRLPKVLAELQGLSLALVDGALADTAIAVAGMEPEDTLKFILDLTTPAAVDVSHCTIIDRRASGTITVGTDVADGDYVTVNGKRYTFKELAVTIATNVAPNVVPITVDASGVADNEEAATNLAAAIMSGDSTLECTVASNVVTVFYRTAGTAGNAKTLATSGAHASVSGATLSGGLAVAGCGFKCSDSTSGKKLVVVWYNKQ